MCVCVCVCVCVVLFSLTHCVCVCVCVQEERLVEELLALGMGFSRQDCEAAAMKAGGNLQVAVNLLIG